MTIPTKSSPDPSWSTNSSNHDYGTVPQQQDTKHAPAEDASAQRSFYSIYLDYSGYVFIGFALMIALVVSLIWNMQTSTIPSLLSSSSKMIASLDMPRTGPIMDLIHIMDDESTTKILSEISAVEQDVPGSEIQIVSANNIQKGFSSPKQFATALFNMWELGDRVANDGVLILFLLDIRRIEVEVGVNLNVYMNREWTEDVLNDLAVPEFKQGNYGVGISNVVERIAERLRDVENGDAQAYPITDDDSTIGIIVFFSMVGSIFCCVCRSCWHQSKYPLGRNNFCTSCGQCDWKHDRWDTITNATRHKNGVRRRYCTCNQCQNVYTVDETIPMLSHDNDHHHGAGGGGGCADGGGGGGAGW